MSSIRSVDEVVGELSGTFSGQLLRPADAGYDEARRVHNGLVDKRPALIARCRGVADVVDAVNLTRKLGLEVAVRGGGHNVAGRATIDGGLVIDLSPMKGIHVDPKGRTVWAQGGVTWGELNRETQLHGLAVTGGVVSSTGIAGLTLGGGLGWLMGKYGLALDNLRSVELVTAEGKVVRTNQDEEPDLCRSWRRWKLRRRDFTRISAPCDRSHGHRRAGCPSVRRSPQPAEVLSRQHDIPAR
jgi:FAD/FMN-containing dehydrogenase